MSLRYTVPEISGSEHSEQTYEQCEQRASRQRERARVYMSFGIVSSFLTWMKENYLIAFPNIEANKGGVGNWLSLGRSATLLAACGLNVL